MCVCDHGYTSLGDFAVTEGMDCGQNVFVQEILNIFSLIFAASFTLLMTRVLYLRLLHKRTLIDAANMTSLQYLLTGLSSTAYSIIKLVNPTKYLVGKSALATFFLSSIFVTSTLGFMSFVFIVCHFFKGYAKTMSSDAKAKVEYSIKKLSAIFPFLSRFPSYHALCH